MSVANFIEPGSFCFPKNATVGLHDIVVILLSERLLSDKRFRRAQLLEVSDGSWPVWSVPNQEGFGELEAPKVGYFLKILESRKDGEASADGDAIEPHNFLDTGLITQRDLDVDEVESIFWTVKNHDSGFLLHHALQLVLDFLPTSTTLLVEIPGHDPARFPAQSFTVAEMSVLPRRAVFIGAMHPKVIVDEKKQISMDMYSFGERSIAEPWVYFVFSNNSLGENSNNEQGNKTSEIEDKDEDDQNPESDPRPRRRAKSKSPREDKESVALDINFVALGGRGLGNETFALCHRHEYHNTLLPRYGIDEDLELLHSPRIAAVSREKAQPAIDLAKCVLRRLEEISRGEVFCAYCGKAGASRKCSLCKGKRYCGVDCQKKAWPYHKGLCKRHCKEMKDQISGEMKD